MTKGRAAFVLLLLLQAATAFSREPVKTSIARPYFECVRDAAVRYAAKAEDVNAVIQAAEASCQEGRFDLLATILAEHAMRGTPGDLEQVGKRTLDLMEAAWRPDIVKAILDAR